VLAFYAPILATLVFDAVLLASLAWAYHAKRFEPRRISMKPSMKIPARERLLNIAVSSVLSLGLVFGLTYLLYQTTLHTRATSAGRMAFDILAILVVYDFAYYWLHRGMHHKSVMKYVHAVHHRVHNPTAMESFYLHPIELCAGLTLLVVCTWLVGPVHIYAFAAVFFLHSTLNITVHSGLVSGRWWLRPIDHLTHKHYIHHAGDFDKNYASLTPLPDMLFGTRG
jgi:sterol desaturase/sphingolipid hydroxylase (fatty acid hydroxylase superfamily)